MRTKRFLWVLGAAAAIFCALVFTGCFELGSDGYRPDTVLRFHIRANSNSELDQNVKLVCRDAVITYLEAELSEVSDLDTAKQEITKRLPEIEKRCDKVLAGHGFSYKSRAKFQNEFFPTRKYEGAVLDSGYYDAVIVELGKADGDNWWCVLYPPLCYLEAKEGGEVFYKSKIAELIQKWTKK